MIWLLHENIKLKGTCELNPLDIALFWITTD